VTDDTGTGCTLPRPWPRGLRRMDSNAARLAALGITTTPWTPTAFHRPGSRLTDKGAHRQRRKGDANEAVIKALVEAGNIIARSRQASVSAFLALEKAGHLPITRNGSSRWTSRSVRSSPRRRTRPRAASSWIPPAEMSGVKDRPTPCAPSPPSRPPAAGAGREPHHRHGREQPDG
jgi:hypothetical protein